MNNGLEGIVAAETRLSMVDGERGELIIAGFRVEELAVGTAFEETLRLLWFEDRDLRDELVARRALASETIDLLRAAAAKRVPVMDALRMGVATIVADDD